MGIILTVADVITDTKRYYNCPRCNRRVWAYGSFVDNVCLDCPGTVLSAIGSTANMSTFEVTRGVTTIANRTVIPATTAIIQTPLGIFEDDAEFKGTLVWRISKDTVSDSLSLSSKSEVIKSVYTRSCGIRSGIIDNTGIDHWWMDIRTNSNWYQIQFRGSGSSIQLRKCSDEDDCDETGLCEAARHKQIQPVHQNSYSCSSTSGKTIGDLTNWIKNGGVSSYYSLLDNNCKHLCKEIYAWI